MRMLKMAAVSTIPVLLLCCFVVTSKGSQDVCDYYAATNADFAVPLRHTLQSSEQLRWTRGLSVIFDRRPNKLVKGNEGDVFKNGSLKLTNLDKSMAGRYTPEVFTEKGKAIQNLKSINLCVVDRVLKPRVTFECPLPSVKFTCTAGQNQDVRFEWLQNDKVVEKVKGHTLDKTAKEVEAQTFSCKVSNRVSFMISAPVKHNCTEPGFVFPDTLLGINSWIIVGGGGGVVLMLIIIIIVCCICNKRKKRMRLKEEEELRLGWANTNQQHHHHQHSHPPNQNQHQHQHQHHHHHHQQQPAGHTGPRQHRSKQPRNQQRPRAPDHPNGQPQPSPRGPAQSSRPANTAEGEQPPPLPQPRKKAPKTPRV